MTLSCYYSIKTTMEIYNRKLKTIPTPNGRVELLGELMPISSSPQFSRLRRIAQTSFGRIVFPASTHTRYLHSFMVYDFVKRNIYDKKDWRWDFLSDEDKKALLAYALVHDIGHAAFSHFAELLSFDGDKIDHHNLGLRIVREMEEKESVFSRSGVDLKQIISLMSKSDSAYQLVTGPIISADKLSYMSLDSTLVGLGDQSWIKSEIIPYITPVLEDGNLTRLAIDIKTADKAEQLMRLYMNLYTTVYLRKGVTILNRMFQLVFQHAVDIGVLTKADFEREDDEIVMGKLRINIDKLDKIYQEYLNRALNGKYHRTAINISYQDGNPLSSERAAETKNISCVALHDDNFKKLINLLEKPAELQRIEMGLERVLSLGKGEVIIAPPMFTERFELPELLITDGTHLIDLSKYYPSLTQSIKDTLASKLSVRICVAEEKRAAISKCNIEKAKGLIDELIQGAD